MNDVQMRLIKKTYKVSKFVVLKFWKFIFNFFNLLQKLTAFENIEIPLIYKKVPKKQRKETPKHGAPCIIKIFMIYYALFFDGPIVYRLGHELFMLGRGVRLSLGLPDKRV